MTCLEIGMSFRENQVPNTKTSGCRGLSMLDRMAMTTSFFVPVSLRSAELCPELAGFVSAASAVCDSALASLSFHSVFLGSH